MIHLVIALVAGWVICYPLTDCFVRYWAPRVIRRLAGDEANRTVCLTFDDGPDARYTPRLLEILQAYRIPAVFFLIAAKAAAAPELVRAIQAGGHQIGFHTYCHRHAYWLGPLQSPASVADGRRGLADVAGETPRWFRPPWGATNLFQYLLLQRWRLPIVLWSLAARDWKTKTGAEGIQTAVLSRVRPGAVILLHDAGGDPGAPEQTLAALPGIITGLMSRGYRFVGLPEDGKGWTE